MRLMAFVASAAVLVFSFLGCQQATAGMLVNGDFEDTSGTFPNGWSIESGGPVVTTGLDGTGSALLLRDYNSGHDRIYQTFTSIDNDWCVDFYFATEEPVNTDDRALNLLLGTIGGTNFINLRIDKSGNIQYYDGSSWKTSIADAIQFSIDDDGDGHFDGGTDTLNVYHMSLVDSPENNSFTINVSNANQEDFSQSALGKRYVTPSGDAYLGSIVFSGSSSTCSGSSVIDNVVVGAVQVPEPGILTLLAGPFALLLLRYRRR